MKIKTEIIFDEKKMTNVFFHNEMELSGVEYQNDYKLAEITLFNLYCSRLYFVYYKIGDTFARNISTTLAACGMSVGKNSYVIDQYLKAGKSIIITMDFDSSGLINFNISYRGFGFLGVGVDDANINSIGILFDYLVKKRSGDDFFLRCLSVSALNLSDYFLKNTQFKDIVENSISIAQDSIESCKMIDFMTKNTQNSY